MHCGKRNSVAIFLTQNGKMTALTFEVILMCLVELLIPENLYFDTAFTKLSALGQKLKLFTHFGNHLGSHLAFTYLDMHGVILILLA